MALQQLGPFELLEQIGAGGMGVVYKARYTKSGQVCALKLLSPQLANDDKLVARFQRELEVLRKLGHVNIVQCFGGGRIGDKRFFAMELVEGGTLADVLKDKGPLSWQDVILYGLQVCAALEHAHEHGIVHRDLKPSNLMLDRKGRLKLADFGLARVSDATALTAAGKTLGTFAYMAPEQITGKHPISAKTDLYALGIVFFELLTGKPPFQSDTAAQLFFQHLKNKPPRICTEVLDCPIWLESLVLQMLEKEPDKRPRDALAVSQALKEVEEKVAAHVSMSQHAVTGEPTAINVTTVEADKAEVEKLVKKKPKRKKREGGEFYEKTWFLVSCLALMAALVVWTFWPASEAKLFAKAEALMASDDPGQWTKARDEYLLPLQNRFPEGPHKAEVQDFLDRIEVGKAEERLMNRLKRGMEMKTEPERLFAEGWKYEQFGDRLTALEKYGQMAEVLAAQPDHRIYVILARRQVARLQEAGAEKTDTAELVRAALERGRRQHAEGKLIEAKKTWDSIVSLYGANRELAPLVDRARARLEGKPEPVETPPE